MDAWRYMTATDLGQGIALGKIDPVDLTEVFLAAIASHADSTRIYARVTADRARAEARAASQRAKAGQRRSALDGVPISWKDLFDTAGVATEAGTALMAGRVPQADADVLVNATAAGLVCLGKTHMSEIAFSGLGLNPITATPPNINDPKAVPGGSSSGAAASVAFGLAAAGIGSDTGGSVRIPAAWNDLVGLKTTHGLLSVGGTVPLCQTFDTVGPICRSVADANALLAALSGDKVHDLAQPSLAGARLALLETVALEGVRPTPLAGFQNACHRLEAAGATIVPVQVPDLVEALAMAGPLYTADSYAQWRPLVEAHPDKMFPQILERVRAGAQVTAADYLANWMRLRDIRRVFAKAVAGFDAVIMPTAPILPPDVARLLSDEAYYVSENLLALRNTRIGNLMDFCGVSLPAGAASCGILLNAAPNQEAAVLRLAAAAEAALA